MAQAVQGRIGLETFEALAACGTGPSFCARERVALAYCEEVTRERRAA